MFFSNRKLSEKIFVKNDSKSEFNDRRNTNIRSFFSNCMMKKNDVILQGKSLFQPLSEKEYCKSAPINSLLNCSTLSITGEWRYIPRTLKAFKCNCISSLGSIQKRIKFLQFIEDTRPPFYGTD